MPSKVVTSSVVEAFNVTLQAHRLCVELCSALPELGHVAMDRVALRLCQTRRSGPYGVQATMAPLRFRDGTTTVVRRGRTWRIEPCPRDAVGEPYLYLLSLYVPRFLDLPATEKAAVLIHELWHASEAFDGDLRRFGAGRTRFHQGGCERYHAEMRRKAARWIALAHPQAAPPWLDDDFARLRTRFRRVVGARIPTPRLVRCD